mgnify:CR=1 FL=1
MSKNPIIDRVQDDNDKSSRFDKTGGSSRGTYVIGVRGPGAQAAIGQILPVLPGITVSRDEVDPEDDPTRQSAVADRIMQYAEVWRQMSSTGMSDQDISDVPAIIYLEGLTPRIAHIVGSNAEICVLFTNSPDQNLKSKFAEVDTPVLTLDSTDAEDVLSEIQAFITNNSEK